MHFEDTIRGRRSIRRYKDKNVPLSMVGEIIDLAKHAPSSGNLQNWRFIIVTDSEMRHQLAEASLEQYWMVEAPVHIVVCNDYKKVKDHYAELGKMYSIQNCANIAYAIQLAAYDLGLGTCWVGAFDNEKVQQLLEIPDDIDPEIIITLGHSQDMKAEQLREQVKYLTYHDKWGKKFTKLPLEHEKISHKAKKEIEHFKKKLSKIIKRKK